MQGVKDMFGMGKKDEKAAHGESGRRSTDQVTGAEYGRTGGVAHDSVSGRSHGDRSGRAEGDAVAVGLPEAGTGTATATYQDTQITDREREFAQGQVRERMEVGQDVAIKEEVTKVPVTTMEKQSVQVPTTEMERFTVSKPVTKTREVPETVRDVEMKQELVEREEVVVDKEMVTQPTTVMKPVKTDVPKVIKERMVVPQVHEEMRRITVVRPRVVKEKVRVMRPVEVPRKVKSKRAVPVKRMVKVSTPVRVADMVNVTQPELSDYTVDVQVPKTEEKHVEYEKPVTVIRSSEAEKLSRDTSGRTSLDRSERREEDKFISKRGGRDWKNIPVGMPFTEMVAKAKNFTTTRLETQSATVRQTVMEPKQFERVGYQMQESEVEVIEVGEEEYEDEILVSELQEFEEEVEVTLMEEFDEEWPVAKESEAEVYTSTVSLEPRTAEVPEIGMKDVEVEKPRTVTKTETIEKAVPVEREVMVEKPYTDHVEVEAERPVEVMKNVEVEKPVVHYEETVVNTPVTVGKDVNTQGVEERTKTVREQEAYAQERGVNYKTAEQKMRATAVGGNVDVGSAGMAAVTDDELARAKGGAMPGAPREEYGANVREGYANEGGYRRDEGADPRAVAPDAMLDGTGRSSANVGGGSMYERTGGDASTYGGDPSTTSAGETGTEKKGMMSKLKDKLHHR